MSETQPHFSDAYRTRLLAHYSPAVVQNLSDWRDAALPEQPGQIISYVRVNQGVSTRPVLYIPGFTESIVAKAPFIADLAERGYDVILPDQNRHRILARGVPSRRDATYSQAINIMSILDAEDIDQVDVVTHSYGSLIFDEMTRLARRMGEHYFEGSKMIMLTPAGFNDQEKVTRLGWRFFKSVITESRTTKDFPDDGDMLKAGVHNFLTNMPRTVRESFEASRRRVDYRQLIKLGQLSVLSYGEDRIYPDSIIEKQMTTAVLCGATWVTPISVQNSGLALRSRKDASHNDEQFNPARVATIVAQLLAAR